MKSLIFLDCYRLFSDKILKKILIFALLSVFLALGLKEVTYGVPHRIFLDLGLGILHWLFLFSAFYLGQKYAREGFENKSMILYKVRPISTFSLFLGKILGPLLFLCSLCFFTLLSFWLFYGLLYSYSFFLLKGIGIILLESVLCYMLSFFVGLNFQQGVSLLISSACFFIGKSFSFILKQDFSPAWIGALFPDFSRFEFKQHLLYQQDLPLFWWLVTTLYGLIWIVIFFFLSFILFRKKISQLF